MFQGPASEGHLMLGRFQKNVEQPKFLTILMEVILIGLAFAVSNVWSEVIVSASEHWLQNWAEPLQRLISALIITALCVLAALLSILNLYTKPRRLKLQEQLRFGASYAARQCDPRNILPSARPSSSTQPVATQPSTTSTSSSSSSSKGKPPELSSRSRNTNSNKV